MVKLQPLDIVDGVVWLVLHLRVVYQRAIKREAALILCGHPSTTPYEGMGHMLPEAAHGLNRCATGAPLVIMSLTPVRMRAARGRAS